MALPRSAPTRPTHQRARGHGRITARSRGVATVLETFYQDGCAKIRLPNTHGAALEGVLINTAGGLTGGDHVIWEATAGPDSALVLTTQACERVYRSLGPDARVETVLRVKSGAHIDWLPQETILFEEARLARTLSVDLDAGATFTGLEAILLGRDAMGETARSARLRDNWRIRRGGRLVHAEATLLSGDPELERDAAALLDRANAFATIVHIGPRAETLLAPVRDVIGRAQGIAASLVGDRLIVRALAPSGLALRAAITPIIALVAGSGTLPRLWTT